MVSEILGLFFNTLTADEKYSVRDKKNLLQPIQWNYLRSKKKNFQFFAALLKPTSNFKHFEKKMSIRADVFFILETS